MFNILDPFTLLSRKYFTFAKKEEKTGKILHLGYCTYLLTELFLPKFQECEMA